MSEMKKHAVSRRSFLTASAAAVSAATIVPRHCLAQSGSTPPSETLRCAFIGVGNRGRANLNGLSGLGGAVVAMADVDAQEAAWAFDKFPKAKRFVDYREMLDAVENDIDVVAVSTPDHTHAVAAMDAMRRGKHVYCEKPLAHSFTEVRAMRKAAADNKVVTQLGNQGHSDEHIRLFCEWIQDGAIGDVHTIHALRPNDYSRVGDLAKLAERPAVPETLDWDLWLGPAAMRPYHPSYLPRSWRGWRPFGTGIIGDWTCHVVDPSFWALDLGAPTSVVAEVDAAYDAKKHALTFPRGMHVTYEFAAKGDRKPVTLNWYDGSFAPPKVEGFDWNEFPNNTCALILGTDGAIRHCSHGAGNVRILPEEQMLAYKRPEPTIPRVKSHYHDFAEAITTGRQAGSNLDYGGPLTELALLGAIASLLPGRKLEWDGPSGKFTNSAEANQLAEFHPREGWELPV